MTSTTRMQFIAVLVRTVVGGGAIAIAFGAALALACLVIGLVLWGVLALGGALVHAAARVTEFAWAFVR